MERLDTCISMLIFIEMFLLEIYIQIRLNLIYKFLNMSGGFEDVHYRDVLTVGSREIILIIFSSNNACIV